LDVRPDDALTRRLLIAATISFAIVGGGVDQFVNWFSRDEHGHRTAISVATALTTYGTVGWFLTRSLLLRARPGQPPLGVLPGTGIGVLCGVVSLFFNTVVSFYVLAPVCDMRPDASALPTVVGIVALWLPILIAAAAWPVLLTTATVGAAIELMNGRRRWTRQRRTSQGGLCAS